MKDGHRFYFMVVRYQSYLDLEHTLITIPLNMHELSCSGLSGVSIVVDHPDKPGDDFLVRRVMTFYSGG